MRALRKLATPLTIGAFCFMACTGILMFFHLDRGFSKLGHEWFGWLFISGVILHATINWKPFARYFTSSNLARAIVGAFVIALAAALFAPTGGRRDAGAPPVLAMRALTHAPISAVAAIAGRQPSDVLEDLRKAGISLPDARASIDSLGGDNRELQSKAIMVLFGQP